MSEQHEDSNDPYFIPHGYVFKIPIERFAEYMEKTIMGYSDHTRRYYQSAIMKFIRTVDPDGSIWAYRALGKERYGAKYQELVRDPEKLKKFIINSLKRNMKSVETNARKAIESEKE